MRTISITLCIEHRRRRRRLLDDRSMYPNFYHHFYNQQHHHHHHHQNAITITTTPSMCSAAPTAHHTHPTAAAALQDARYMRAGAPSDLCGALTFTTRHQHLRACIHEYVMGGCSALSSHPYRHTPDGCDSGDTKYVCILSIACSMSRAPS